MSLQVGSWFIVVNSKTKSIQKLVALSNICNTSWIFSSRTWWNLNHEILVNFMVHIVFKNYLTRIVWTCHNSFCSALIKPIFPCIQPFWFNGSCVIEIIYETISYIYCLSCNCFRGWCFLTNNFEFKFYIVFVPFFIKRNSLVDWLGINKFKK